MPSGTISTWSVKLRDGPDGEPLPGFVSAGGEVDVKADDGSGWLLVVAEIDGEKRLGFLDGCYVFIDQDPQASNLLATRPEGFTYEIIAAAQEANRKRYIPASVTLAQWALHSAFGRLTPPGSNNPFGIKAADATDSVVARTRQHIDGKSTYVLAHFRQFASIAEAIDNHVKSLAEDAQYARARTALPDPNKFADALTEVYSDIPGYGASLQQIIRTYGLT